MRMTALGVLAAGLLTSGCTWTSGVVTYPTAMYVAVSGDPGGEQALNVFSGPDLAMPYEVKAVTLFAKNDFKVELQPDGTVKKLDSNMDATAGISPLIDLAKTALEEAATKAMAASSASLTGRFNMEPGLYKLERDGTLTRAEPPKSR